MKLIYSFVAVFIFITQAFSQCASTSNISTFNYGGKTYELVKELKSWSDAAFCAKERGGYLVEINDLNEQNAVYNAIAAASVSHTYTSIANGGGIAYVWMGATDQKTEGSWLWDGNDDKVGVNFWTGEGANGAGNGLAVSGAFNNWGGKSTSAPNEPDNFGSNQNYGAIALAGWPAGTTMLGKAGEWNDIIGSSLLYFIIEPNAAIGLHNQEGLKEQLRFYPNPTNGVINFEKDYAQIELYDLSGKQLLTVTNTHYINISELAKGIYEMRVKEEGKVLSQKVILN